MRSEFTRDELIFRLVSICAVFILSTLMFVIPTISASSSIEVDLPNFCDTEPNDDITLDFSDYLSLDLSKELGLCYVFHCEDSSGTSALLIRDPVCLKNSYYSLQDDYFEFLMFSDVLDLSMDMSESGDKCVALFGLAECDWSYQNCYSVLYKDGQWEWLPSDRYNDIMNVHIVLEMNDPTFTNYKSSFWGNFVGNYCDAGESPSGTADLTTGLNAYFSFDVDSSDARGHEVVAYNDPDFTNSGILGNCYKSPVANDAYLIVNDLSYVNGLYNWTYNYWVKGTGSSGYVFDAIDSFSDGDHISSYAPISDYKLRFRTKDVVLSTTTLNDDWRMVTIVHTDGYYKYYINGSLSFTSGHYAPIQFPSSFVIGADAYRNNNFDGYIDELGFWIRSLSSGEITDLYNSGVGLTYDGFTFVSTSPNYNVSLDNEHLNITLDFNESYCFNLDYYFDNWDWFNVTVYDPVSQNATNITHGESTLHGDYFEVGLGIHTGFPTSELCFEAYEKNYAFNVSAHGCDDIQCIEDVIYVNVTGNYSAGVYSRFPFEYAYVIYPSDVSESFSMNYFYGNYEVINVTFEMDGSNHSFECDKDDGFTYTYNGTLNYTMDCRNDNVYFVFDMNDDFDDFYVYVNASNQFSSLDDYFRLISFSAVPFINLTHSNVSMSFFDTYVDNPEDYFSYFSQVYVEVMIPSISNFQRLSKGSSLVEYDPYTINYLSNGTLIIASKDTDYSFCVWYIAENTVGSSVISYSVAISSDGNMTDYLDCSQVYGSSEKEVYSSDLESDTDILDKYFYIFSSIFPDNVDEDTKFRLVAIILIISSCLIFFSLFRYSFRVAFPLTVFAIICILFFFAGIDYIRPIYPILFLFVVCVSYFFKFVRGMI